MFYRITVDCNYPGILFQMSLFRILQQFHKDPLAKSKQFAVKNNRIQIFFAHRLYLNLGRLSICYLVITKIFSCNRKKSVYLC